VAAAVFAAAAAGAGCSAAGPEPTYVAPPIVGRWSCGQIGELVIVDLGHYAISSGTGSGHFIITLDHEIAFEPDGPLAGEVGRWNTASGQLEIGPASGPVTCIVKGPAPSSLQHEH
jgi:hypothetical protein